MIFLIPFYIFSHESRFEEYNTDNAKLESLKVEYEDIVSRLEGMQEGRLEMLIDLVRENILSLPDAAAKGKLSEEEFVKRMQEYEK